VPIDFHAIGPLTDHMSMWIADLERRLCDFLGILPDDDDIAAVTPTSAFGDDLAGSEHQSGDLVPARGPCVPDKQQLQVTLPTTRAPSKVHAHATGAAFDTELGVLRRTLCELRDGLDGDA
jgi:hypothetical protein